MLDQLPDIQIIATDSIIHHEQHDNQRTPPLVEKLRASGIMRNPVLVTPLQDGSDRYMVMDGANRVMAFQLMGTPHVLTQVVAPDSGSVELKTWNHVLWNANPEELLADLEALPGINLLTIPDDDAGLRQLRNHEILVWIQTPDQCTHAVFCETGDLVHMLNGLNAIVDTYKHKAHMDRTRIRKISALANLYENLCAVIVFPPFTIRQVLELAGKGHLFPSGITRFTVAPRALRIEYPLSELESNDSLEAKNQRLQAWIQERVTSKGVRFYAEPTVLFDE
ncbi:MAG: hypothetical protein JXB38_20790 [Anaerolineales bacterium]|nr:hypothetical protein [Anaerolineales bacterium]